MDGMKNYNDASCIHRELLENYDTVMDAIIKAKPAAAKGQYIKSTYLSTTMSPSVKFNYGA